MYSRGRGTVFVGDCEAGNKRGKDPWNVRDIDDARGDVGD